MKNVLILLLMALSTLCACSRDESPVNIPKHPPGTPDASIVVANCDTLKAAVERFASENGGIYPANVDVDTSLVGHTVLDLLPAAGLENPFTKSKEAPVNGAADSPGEVGYVPVAQDGWNVGYVVTGFGADALVAELSNLGSPEEAKVIANCFLVRQAVEEIYRSRGQLYPGDNPSDGWPYLHLESSIVNPFTELDQQPVGRTASSPGEIGYVLIVQHGVRVGYIITGYGASSVILALTNLGYSRDQAVVASGCRTTQLAVEEHADAHGGVYPSSTPCPSGVAYEAIQSNGWDIGYEIRGSVQGAAFVELTNIDSPEELSLRVNCFMLKQSVEAFAAQSGGRYPLDLDTDKTSLGQTVVDLLPRAHPLENSYTGAGSNPVNHSATLPGEIGYALVHEYRPRDGRYIPPGYVITGFVNRWVEVAISNIALNRIDAIVMSHCRTVELAVQQFAARNNGVYPFCVDIGTTLDGKTVVDLLPAGCKLVNPATWCASEPGNMSAANPGQVGYLPVYQHHSSVGYAITGVGTENGTTIMYIVKEPPMLSKQ
ncbi:MAG TPA: hypothetical protein VII85_07800 [Candidatus Krumholzibacteriaceae bacterium]